MTTLREIQQKLHSLSSVQKITQAMELVAASRLRKALKKMDNAKPYCERLNEILTLLPENYVEINHPLLEKRKIVKTGLIIISADRGLCGSYNQSVFSAAEKFLSGYSKDALDLILVGRKANEYFKKRGWAIEESIKEWGGKIRWEDILEFGRMLMYRFLKKKWDEIWIVYTSYQSMSARKVKVEKFLNMEISVGKPEKMVESIIEPSCEGVLGVVLPGLCVAKLLEIFNHAYASELSARVLSMQSATKNAKEKIEELTIVRNKLRQRGITREMIEISSAAEYLNS